MNVFWLLDYLQITVINLKQLLCNLDFDDFINESKSYFIHNYFMYDYIKSLHLDSTIGIEWKIISVQRLHYSADTLFALRYK